MHSTPIIFAALAALAAAKTDLANCVSSKTVNPFAQASVLWYIPDTCEICELLDCGGGRAPPKSTVPGCGAYTGTETYSPSFLPSCGAASATTPPAASTTSDLAVSTSMTPAADSKTVSLPNGQEDSSTITAGSPLHGPVVTGTSTVNNNSTILRVPTTSGQAAVSSELLAGAAMNGAGLAQGIIGAAAVVAGLML